MLVQCSQNERTELEQELTEITERRSQFPLLPPVRILTTYFVNTTLDQAEGIPETPVAGGAKTS
jgi:hypothetical protein